MIYPLISIDNFSPEHEDKTMIVTSNPKQLLNLVGFLFLFIGTFAILSQYTIAVVT